MLCVNVTRGIPCGHPIEEHDSGGCCRAPFCECSHIVTVKIPAAKPRQAVTSEEDATAGPSYKPTDVCRHAGVMSEEDCLHCNPRPLPVRLREAIELLKIDIESASFADLAKWAYEAQKFIKGLING